MPNENPFTNNSISHERVILVENKKVRTHEEELEEELMKDPMIEEIRHPSEADVSFMDKKYRDFLRDYIQREGPPLNDRQVKYLEGLISYVESPYIIDKFGDAPDAHVHRREWRNQMGEKNLELRKFYENNKLKYNNLLGIVESARMNLVKVMKGQNKSERDELLRKIDEAGYKDYHNLTLDKKIEVAKLVDQLAKEMLIDSIT